MKTKLIFLLFAFSLYECNSDLNNKCPVVNFVYEDTTIRLNILVPSDFSPIFDSGSIKQHNIDFIKNIQSAPEGRMVFSYIDSINNNELSVVYYDKSLHTRFGALLFDKYDDINEILNFLQKNLANKQYGQDKTVTIDLHANLKDSSIILREFLWFKNSEILDPHSVPNLFYVENIISRKRDIQLYFTFPPMPFEKADSLIACHLRYPLIQEVYFK